MKTEELNLIIKEGEGLTVEFSMIACILVIPLALICGSIRGISFLGQLIDCSFGIFGIIPLRILRNDIKCYSNQIGKI